MNRRTYLIIHETARILGVVLAVVGIVITDGGWHTFWCCVMAAHAQRALDDLSAVMRARVQRREKFLAQVMTLPREERERILARVR